MQNKKRMRLEDIKIDLTPKDIDERMWDKEKWRKENSVDYFKYMALLRLAKDETNTNNIFWMIKKTVDLYLPDTLYKYYALTDDEELDRKKFETLKGWKVYLSSPKEFNDPFDGRGFFYNPNEFLDINELRFYGGRIIDDFASFTISTALTSNGVNSMPMWAHYGSNHAGYCVSYDMNDEHNSMLRINTYPIQYIKERVDISGYLKEYVKQLMKRIQRYNHRGGDVLKLIDNSIVYMNILFTNLKHETWSYENEFRCTTASNSPDAPFNKAKPKELFIGMNCSQNNTNKLIDLAKEMNIDAYRMRFDDLSDTYDLIPHAVWCKT